MLPQPPLPSLPPPPPPKLPEENDALRSKRSYLRQIQQLLAHNLQGTLLSCQKYKDKISLVL